ncbi:hypothetical protein [Saccharopolyspora thermophila]|uniref:hypothetical protein n=1 Tax=Saccharopolyspora thermophila TaxID=89367 RepID=UPI0031F79F06
MKLVLEEVQQAFVMATQGSIQEVTQFVVGIFAEATQTVTGVQAQIFAAIRATEDYAHRL